MVPDDIRRNYTDEIAALAGIRSPALLQAFASVPRERFLGPAPWKVLAPATGGASRFQMMEVSDPRDLYRNVAVMLDESRTLANGNPGTLAPWLNALNLAEGHSVFHLGCGAGYYSAVMAEAVGPGGRVTAVEIDPKLASMARTSLSSYQNVKVIEGDGGALDPGPADAILINAGVTHPTTQWLDSLRPGGNLILPLTVDVGVPNVGKGLVLHINRKACGDTARFLPDPVMIYSCSSVRDAAVGQLLGKSFMSGTMASVQSLRRDMHSIGANCWLHTETFCLSTASSSEFL